MTKKLSYTRLSKSRFEGLKLLFPTPGLTARELGVKMWGEHKMALVNAKAVIRELYLGNLISKVTTLGSKEEPRFLAAAESKPILDNPSWICRYCSLDTTNSNKRLWAFQCIGCGQYHYACRFCKKHLVKVTGNFPYYKTQVRACPGKIEIPKRPERKPRPKNEKSRDKAPGMVQGDLYGAAAAGL